MLAPFKPKVLSGDWSTIHEQLMGNLFEAFLEKNSVEDGVTVMITMHYLDSISEKAAKKIKPQRKTAVTPEQAEVVDYITGAILHKLHQRYNRKGKAEEKAVLHELVEDREKGLIAVKTKGGLLQPKKEICILMHRAFEIFNDNKKSTRHQFVGQILNISEFKTSELVKIPSVMKDVIYLFHKILKHHDCFKVLESVKIKKKCSGKGRSLRAKLADKNSL